MLIAWTTVATSADAERIATEVIGLNLAVCVQIEGPIISRYRWSVRIEEAEEYRLCFKLVEAQAKPLEERVLAMHPYETPEWLTVRAEYVGEKYLSWARTNSSTRPL